MISWRADKKKLKWNAVKWDEEDLYSFTREAWEDIDWNVGKKEEVDLLKDTLVLIGHRLITIWEHKLTELIPPEPLAPASVWNSIQKLFSSSKKYYPQLSALHYSIFFMKLFVNCLTLTPLEFFSAVDALRKEYELDSPVRSTAICSAIIRFIDQLTPLDSTTRTLTAKHFLLTLDENYKKSPNDAIIILAVTKLGSFYPKPFLTFIQNYDASMALPKTPPTAAGAGVESIHHKLGPGFTILAATEIMSPKKVTGNLTKLLPFDVGDEPIKQPSAYRAFDPRAVVPSAQPSVPINMSNLESSRAPSRFKTYHASSTTDLALEAREKAILSTSAPTASTHETPLLQEPAALNRLTLGHSISEGQSNNKSTWASTPSGSRTIKSLALPDSDASLSLNSKGSYDVVDSTRSQRYQLSGINPSHTSGGALSTVNETPSERPSTFLMPEEEEATILGRFSPSETRAAGQTIDNTLPERGSTSSLFFQPQPPLTRVPSIADSNASSALLAKETILEPSTSSPSVTQTSGFSPSPSI